MEDIQQHKFVDFGHAGETAQGIQRNEPSQFLATAIPRQITIFNAQNQTRPN